MFGYDDNVLSGNSDRWNFKEINEIIDTAEKRFNEIVAPIKDNSYLCLLNESFAKSVLYMREILVLLYNGFPDGAMTLGKDIYETMIILSFFEKNKEDENLLDRYFDNLNIKLIGDSVQLLNFLNSGADDETVKAGINDMLSQKKRNYKAFKDKHNETVGDKGFKSYWWIGDILPEPSHSFNGLHKDSEWYNTIFRHIYNIASHQGHSSLVSADNESPVAMQTLPTTEGFNLPVCFTLTAFCNIFRIVFFNYDIEYKDLDKKCEEIIKPLFAEIWKEE